MGTHSGKTTLRFAVGDITVFENHPNSYYAIRCLEAKVTGKGVGVGTIPIDTRILEQPVRTWSRTPIPN